MKSILVIRLTSLGDVVLATPVVRVLRRAYPEARIDVAVDQRFAEVWNDNPNVHYVHAVVKGSEQNINAHSYDLVVDLQRSRRSARIIRKVRSLSGAPIVVRYSKHRFEKLALVYCKRKPKTTQHIVDRYLAPLRDLGVANDGLGLELWTTGTVPGKKDRLDQRRLRIGVAPGAQHETKRYPAQLMAKVVERLRTEHGADVVLLGGMADVDLCNEIANQSSAALERADGAATLDATIRVLDTLDAVVSCDSAMVHMAAARGVPVAVVYGSTAPGFGFAPYQVPHVVVQAPDVTCRPCTHIGRPSCPKGHFRCMNDISPVALAQEVINLSTKNLGA